jgi:hypothetical protein
MKLTVTRVGDWAAAGDRMAADASAPNPSLILSRRLITGTGLFKTMTTLQNLGRSGPIAKPHAYACA